MTDEGILFWCLNLRVTRDKQRGLLKIDQQQYVEEMLKKFNMESCNTRRTSMREKPALSNDMCPDKQQDYDETFPYACAMGYLLFLRLTRSDILVELSILARFMKNPIKTHWEAVKDLFRYVRGGQQISRLARVYSKIKNPHYYEHDFRLDYVYFTCILRVFTCILRVCVYFISYIPSDIDIDMTVPEANIDQINYHYGTSSTPTTTHTTTTTTSTSTARTTA